MNRATLTTFAGQGQVAALRFHRRREIRRIYRTIVDGWDHAAFISTFRDYWDPFNQAAPVKYLKPDVWLQRAIEQYLSHRLFADHLPRRVLDLGCGMGYFLEVCRQHGHDVMGLDLDDEPIYNLSVELLNLGRVVHRVEPDDILPELGAPFDVITSFMTCFNFRVGREDWDESEWASFLPRLHALLRPGGVVLIQFNQSLTTGRLYPAGLPEVIRSDPRWDGRFYREYLRLNAVAPMPLRSKSSRPSRSSPDSNRNVIAW